jgi:CRISPR type IV-associated protein Csf2
MKTATASPAPTPVTPATNTPKSVRITGTFTLTSPFHQSCVRPCWADLTRMKVTGEKLDFPATGTVNMPILVPAGASESVEEGTQSNPLCRRITPIIKENSIRGKLRRIAASLVLNPMAERGQKVTGAVYRGMKCGAVTGNGNQPQTMDTALEASRNAFLALCGGGPRMCKTHYRIGLIPAITQTTVNAGMVPSQYEHLAAQDERDLTHLVAFIRNDDMVKFIDPSEAICIEDYPAEIRSWMDEIAGNNDKRKEQKGAQRTAAAERAAAKVSGKKAPKVQVEKMEKESKVAVQGFNFTEVVIPGTSFYFDFELLTDRMPLASLGLFLRALTELVNEQHIGGWGRNGWGKFSTDANLSIDGTSIGKLFNCVAGNYTLAYDEGSVVGEALDAWADTSSKMTAAELEKLYTLKKDPGATETPADPDADAGDDATEAA